MNIHAESCINEDIELDAKLVTFQYEHLERKLMEASTD